MARILSFSEIKSILPYQYPMLMLDRVAIESDTHAWGVKNLSINELFFQGHFPNNAIMPGVLQVEGMKQLCELMVIDRINPGRDQQIYMRVVEKVKFRNPNTPGDRVKIESDLLSLENNEAVFQCKTSNASGLTCEAKITLAVRPFSNPAEMPVLWNEADKNADSVMTSEAIQKMIPHRYPFLLVDHVSRRDGDSLVVVKNLTGNEEVFFGSPTLSESLQCEIVAQSGCICVLGRPENQGKFGYFMTIDHAECFAPVFPGDQLICDITLPPGKSRFGKGTGTIKVGEKIVFKITLMFAIVDA